MTQGARIRRRRQALGLSQARLAAELGVDQSTVAKWERGPNNPRSTVVERLAERLGVSLAWLLTGEEAVAKRAVDRLEPGLGEAAAVARWPYGGEGPEGAAERRGAPGPFVPAPRPLQRGLRDLPVFGVAVGGDDAVFEFNGQVHEYVERPAQLDGVHNAYALYVLGDSMQPRYLEGEIVYINPNRPVTPNCFVAVELRAADGGPGTGMIKQFVKRTPTKLVLRQLNPARTLEFPLDGVKHCHRIVQSGEP